MKILLVTNICPPYRVGLFELLGETYDIEFLFFAGSANNFDGDVSTGKFRGRYLDGFQVLPKIRVNPALISKLLFGDYTHLIKCINGPVPLLASYFIARLRGKKFVLWTGVWHHPQTLFHRLSFPFAKYLYRHSDAITVYGSHVEAYLARLGVPREKISVAWQAQDNDKFTPAVSAAEKNGKRMELGITTRRVLLFIGRVVEQKGVRLLLEAFRSLDEQADVSLLLIGRGSLVEEVRRAAATSGRIFHVPRVPPEELYLYYAAADVLVLPSITTETFKEPWGFVVNEAMCQGCAVIASDAVGAAAGGLVEHGRNGLVVPEQNVEALAAAIRTLMSNDEMLEQMRAKARAEVRRWTYPRMAKGFARALAIANGSNQTSRGCVIEEHFPC